MFKARGGAPVRTVLWPVYAVRKVSKFCDGNAVPLGLMVARVFCYQNAVIYHNAVLLS